MNRVNAALPITYREYRFTPDFPLLWMEGTVTTAQADFLHFHNCLEIAVCERGSMIWNLENETLRMEEGSFCFLPPFFTHASFFPPQEGAVLCHYLFFRPELLLSPFYPNGLPEEFQWYRYTGFRRIMTAEDYPEEKQLLQLLLQELQQEKAYFQQTARGLAEALLALLYRHHRGNPASTASPHSIPQLFPAVAYLDKEFVQELDLPLLAQLCGLSQKRFLEKFRQSFHQTPLQYLRTLRVRKACYLLSSTEAGILDIALETGFQSLSGFHRAFQRVMGCSARDFRNEQRVILKKNPRHAPYTGHVHTSL